MKVAYWHLMIHYLPIVGTTISTILLICGLLLKNNQLKLTSIAAILLMSVIGFIAHETGEGTEQSLKNDKTINEAILQAHEEFAKPAFIIHNIAGGFSIIALALYKKKKRTINLIGTSIVILSLSAVGLMSYVCYLDGKIRHTNLDDTDHVYRYYEMNIKGDFYDGHQ